MGDQEGAGLEPSSRSSLLGTPSQPRPRSPDAERPAFAVPPPPPVALVPFLERGLLEHRDRDAADDLVGPVVLHDLAVAGDALEDGLDVLLGMDDELARALVVRDQRAPHAIPVLIGRAALGHQRWMPLKRMCASGFLISRPHSTTIILVSASPVRAIRNCLKARKKATAA